MTQVFQIGKARTWRRHRKLLIRSHRKTVLSYTCSARWTHCESKVPPPHEGLEPDLP